MTFVTKRKIDELGRFVLPADHRNHYRIKEGDGVIITLVGQSILVTKTDQISPDAKIVDALGRIVIPKAIRSKLNLEPRSDLEIRATENGILLTPSVDTSEISTSDYQVLRSMIPEGSSTYEQDYRQQRQEYHNMMDEAGHGEAFDLIKKLGIMSDIDKRFLALPHVINPTIKLAYDKCLLMLDSWAMLKGGRIKGEVSYERFDAIITVIFPFFEFLEGSSIEYLRFLTMYARNVTFQPSDDGNIEMHVCFDYFEDIGDKDAIIEEEIQKHPELVEALNASADKERTLILEDPTMYAFLTKAAESIGVTPEEYLDRFEDVWEENPMAIMELLHNELRKKKECNDEKDE